MVNVLCLVLQIEEAQKTEELDLKRQEDEERRRRDCLISHQHEEKVKRDIEAQRVAEEQQEEKVFFVFIHSVCCVFIHALVQFSQFILFFPYMSMVVVVILCVCLSLRTCLSDVRTLRSIARMP